MHRVGGSRNGQAGEPGAAFIALMHPEVCQAVGVLIHVSKVPTDRAMTLLTMSAQKSGVPVLARRIAASPQRAKDTLRGH